MVLPPNPRDFVLDEIPDLHPLSASYRSFWREEKRKCIEGNWVGGYWMPPALYFYANYGTIKLNRRLRAAKVFARPNLRDLEWDFFYHYTEARGFSGFELDDSYSSNRVLLDPSVSLEELQLYYPNTISSTGQPKQYVPARTYMRQYHTVPLGRPLFENDLRNLMMMGCYTKDHEVRMYDGSTKTVLQLKKGDKLLGIDSEPRTVTSIIRSIHKAPAYKITQSYGKDYYVTEDHELELMVAQTDGTRIRQKIKAKDLYKEKLRLKTFKTKYRGFKRSAVDWGTDCSNIIPYYLGLWLGDGDSRDQTICTSDPEIINYMRELAHKLSGQLSLYDNKEDKPNRKQSYRLYIKNSPLKDILRALNMLNNKHIPKEILTSSLKNRQEFLAGLIDSDGNAHANQYTIYQKDKIEGLTDLILSLGLTITNTYSRRRTTVLGKDTFEHRITFTGDSITDIPVKIARKKIATKPTKNFNLISIDIEPVEDDYFFGITVDKDHSYCHADYTLTGNSRDTGKSYMVGAGLVPHNFLFDGATEYTEESVKNPSPIEVLVGAEISDKSADILKKTKECLDYLPGQKVISGRTYPAPFSKKYTGSWAVNSEIIAQYNKKVNGKWERAGSRSSIKHRSFNENPFAAQGTRPLLLVLEEIGMFSSLKDVYQHTVDALRSGLRKTGMLMMLGTGGDMEKGTIHASEMFYEPQKYDILPFEDTWEFRGQIGYFVPAYLALNEYKDDNGYSKIEQAKEALLKVRDKKRGDSSSSDALNSEIQYRPLVPSEMFLSRSANIFPTAELRRRLTEIQTHKIYDLLEKKVDLYFDPSSPYNGVNYQINSKAEAISRFPYDGDNREGTVVLYELPYLQDGKVPQGAYIIGCDPFKDDSQTGASLAAIYVIKTTKHMSSVGHDEIVASYIGRPYLGKNHVNEILHKLSLFYGNAKIYFENAVGNVKDYFEKVHRLDLLALQPITVFNKKASYNSQQSLIYGYPMSNQKVKWEALQYLRTWLLTSRADGKRNVDLIPDPGLLQELISFNMDGNFDRVMGFVGCIIGLEELYNLSRKSDIYREAHSELDKEFDRFLVKNKRLFNENFTTTDAVLPAKVEERLSVG